MKHGIHTVYIIVQLHCIDSKYYSMCIYIYIYTSYHTQVKQVDTDIKHQPWNLTSLERRIKKSSGISRFPTHWDLRTCGSCWRSNSCSQCQVAPIRWEKCEKTSERKNICQKMQGSQHENSCKMAQHSKNTSSVKQLSKQLHVTNNLHHSNIFHFFFKCLSYFFYLVGAYHPHLVAYQFSAWENHGHFEVQTRMPCVPNLNQQQPKLHISPGIWLPFEKNNQAFEAVSF